MKKLFARAALLALLSLTLSGCAGFAETMAAAGAQQQNEPVDDYEWLDNRQRSDTSATGVR